ncbi:uncharacterized protein BDZ99DRAFT_467978 [Mytilinidion resinicola]|uniref:Myb-like domain-containing protein n=1 Tax=Mytilinidion resinicola TaxID=574789 RepID=A0A6A6Y7A9_9PEZI|nr:uncharacterized protein BDZ99DRAFT_467978 [Mytilinidion resinicola]KAF2803864.1 hypothetical protein BDZ99DRAFT_467978 [Mytilinidion resinicola]
MADRRPVRASSRRKTPTPQPASKANTPTTARTSTRIPKRATRSQSHEVETPAVAPAPSTKNTRRGARQASTESIGSTDSRASRTTRGQKKQQKNIQAPPVRDLTTVEEDEDAEEAVDAIPEQEAPGTLPSHDQIHQPLPHRSPGGFSNISAQWKKPKRPSTVHWKAYEFLGVPKRDKQTKSRRSVTNKEQAPEATKVNQEIIEDDWQPAPIDDEELEDPQEELSTARFPPSTNDRVARLAQEEQIQKENRKQRFVDPQANTERVAWTQDTQLAPRPSGKSKGKAPIRASTTSPRRPSASAPKAQKRTHAQAVQEESDEDDDDFQQDTRQFDVSKRRKVGPTASRLRFEEPIKVPPGHQPQRRFPENRSRSVLLRPSSQDSDFEDEDEDEDAVPTSSNYRQVQQQAKRMTPAFPVRQAQRRARNPWTACAEDQLVRYIEEYGCQWAYIKSLDEADTKMFLDRTDVDLKDKARNMKINYLRYVDIALGVEQGGR